MVTISYHSVASNKFMPDLRIAGGFDSNQPQDAYQDVKNDNALTFDKYTKNNRNCPIAYQHMVD